MGRADQKALGAYKDWFEYQRAVLSDKYGVGKSPNWSFGERQGAQGHAYAIKRKQFAESPLGKWYAKKGGTAFEDAFMMQTSGGFTHLWGAPVGDDALKRYLRMNDMTYPGPQPPGAQPNWDFSTRAGVEAPYWALAAERGLASPYQRITYDRGRRTHITGTSTGTDLSRFTTGNSGGRFYYPTGEGGRF